MTTGTTWTPTPRGRAFPRTPALMEDRREQFWNRLRDAGIPGVPDEFSVTFAHQEIPAALLAEIDDFIRVFEDVTTRPVWRENVVGSSGHSFCRCNGRRSVSSAPGTSICPPTARGRSSSSTTTARAFFSPASSTSTTTRSWNRSARRSSKPRRRPPELGQHVIRMVRREAEGFFGAMPEGLFLILDEPDALERGKFQGEMDMLRELFRGEGWRAEVASTAELRWDGESRFGAAASRCPSSSTAPPTSSWRRR